MTYHARTIETLPHVVAQLHYLVPMAETPRNYTFDPPAGTPRSNAAYEARKLPIYDARPVASEISFDREGFAVVRQQSAVHDFYDDDEVRRVYYPKAERFIAEVTGAQRVRDFPRKHRAEDAGVPSVVRRRAGRGHH